MPQKILVVEDDNATRVLYVAILAGAGFDAIAVSRLKTAMQAITEELPDAVVADVRLASEQMLENGLQLAALNPRSIPIVMVSGYPDPELERQAHQLGAAYLLKPVSPTALIDILRSKLAGEADRTH